MTNPPLGDAREEAAVMSTASVGTTSGEKDVAGGVARVGFFFGVRPSARLFAERWWFCAHMNKNFVLPCD